MTDDLKRPPADGVAPAPRSDYFGSGKADAPTLRQDSRIAAPAPLREPEKGQLVKWLRMATASRDTAAVWENGTFKERPLHLIAADHIEALEFELAQAQTEKDKFHDQWFSEAKRAQSAEAEVEKLRSDLAQTQAEKAQALLEQHDRIKSQHRDWDRAMVREVESLRVALQEQKDNRNRDLTTMKHVIRERNDLQAALTRLSSERPKEETK